MGSAGLRAGLSLRKREGWMAARPGLCGSAATVWPIACPTGPYLRLPDWAILRLPSPKLISGIAMILMLFFCYWGL